MNSKNLLTTQFSLLAFINAQTVTLHFEDPCNGGIDLSFPGPWNMLVEFQDEISEMREADTDTIFN